MSDEIARSIDCHAHIIDPARFPIPGGRGYQPKSRETGSREAYNETLRRHGVERALLVQPSCYGIDNAAMLDAMADKPDTYKGIAVVAPEIDEESLARLDAAGVVGVRYNLVSADPNALHAPRVDHLLGRLAKLDWHIQVFADDAQWTTAAPVLRRAGVRVLVDHFGVQDVTSGIGQPGFQSVLNLGREGLAAIKLSAAFRLVTGPDGIAALDPYVSAILEAFRPERCVWGSDWPFLGVETPPDYDGTRSLLARWLSPDEMARVFWTNPVALFGFRE